MSPEPVRLPMAAGDELGAGREVVGDRDEEFAAFVGAAGPYLLHTAELLSGDWTRAQDLVQATFERTYRSWARARDGDPWAYARIIEYPRGTFSDTGECGGRPGEQPFDGVARADLDRILAAVERSGVPTDELASARYAPDGTLEAAGFLRAGGGIEWNFAYLFSPDEKPREWESPLGPVTVTRIGDTGWWFEKAPDD